MVSDETSDFSFTWGDSVLVKTKAPARYRPGSYGLICGTSKTLIGLFISSC